MGQFLSLTGPQAAKVAARDPQIVAFFQRLVMIVRNIAQGGTGITIRTSPYLPAMTLAEADALVAVAIDAMQAQPVGLRVTISDSTLPASGNFAAVITGGGADTVPAWYDGGNWRIG